MKKGLFKNIFILGFICVAELCKCVHASVTAFENVNILPMTSDTILKDRRVVIENGNIISIESMAADSSVQPAEVVDLDGRYMLPGFCDTHYHQTTFNYSNKYDQVNFNLLIANGVTSVRSMGELNHTPQALQEGWGQDVITIRNYTQEKGILAPFYVTTGPHIEGGDIKSSSDAIKVVQNHKKRGYDFIKIHGDLDKEGFLTLLREAEKEGIPVVGHAQRNMPLEYSLRQYGLAHLEEIVMVLSNNDPMNIVEIDSHKASQVAKRVKNSGIYISPTLGIIKIIEKFIYDDSYEQLKRRDINKYVPLAERQEYMTDGKLYRREIFRSDVGKRYVERMIRANNTLVLAMYKQGVPLLVGSDNIGLQVAGFSLHDEMKLIHEAGVPTYDVLRAATLTSARFLRRSATAGTIEVGKNAEFVVLNKNPLSNIENTKDIFGVMLKGQWLDRSHLNSLLDEASEILSKI